MIIHDFGGSHSVHSIAQLEQLLAARFTDQLNEFSLCADSSLYPLLIIFVRGDLATIYYIPADMEAGYMSIGKKTNLDPKGETTFATGDLDEPIDFSNEFVIPFSEALKVAREFFHSTALPRSIEWEEPYEREPG